MRSVIAPKPTSFSSVSGDLRELADRDARAAERDRPDDGVDARAVLEARVDERRRLVDAATERRDDALDDGAHALVVGEARVARASILPPCSM